MKIGIFDSGIGGLSLLLCAGKLLPRAEFLYFADTDNVPYGEKSREDIIRFSDTAVDFLYGKGSDAVVVACNTATSAAIIDLRKKYESGDGAIPIVGMEPAVKRAIDLCSGGRILTAATPLTVKGAKLKNLLDRFDTGKRTDAIPLPGLVRLAEAGDFNGAEEYIRGEIDSRGIDISRYSALVLGCTHFNYFKDSFRNILPDGARIVDGTLGTVSQLLRRLELEPGKLDGDSVESIMSRTSFFASCRETVDENEILRMKKSLMRLEEMEKID